MMRVTLKYPTVMYQLKPLPPNHHHHHLLLYYLILLILPLLLPPHNLFT